jgi:hypothetical protein
MLNSDGLAKVLFLALGTKSGPLRCKSNTISIFSFVFISSYINSLFAFLDSCERGRVLQFRHCVK